MRHLCGFLVLWFPLLAGAFPSTALGIAGKPLSIDELVASARVIVVGKIAAVTSSWNNEQTQILTRVDLQLEEVLRGAFSGDRIAFVQPGGRVGNVGSVVSDAPSFTEGERVVLFLVPRRDGQLAVMGLYQGKFSVEQDSASGVDVAVRRVPGSGQTLDRMTLEMLRSRVLPVPGK